MSAPSMIKTSPYASSGLYSTTKSTRTLTCRRKSVRELRTFPVPPSVRYFLCSLKCMYAAEPNDSDATLGPRPASASLWNCFAAMLAPETNVPPMAPPCTHRHALFLHVCCTEHLVEPVGILALSFEYARHAAVDQVASLENGGGCF